MEADLLEGEVADLAHHEARDAVDHEQHQDVLVRRSLAAEEVVEEDGGGDDIRRRGDGQPDEVPLLGRGDLHVEAGEPERTAGHVERRGKPPPAAPGAEGPLVDENAGCHAERHEIRERIVLDAEGAHRAGEPRDPAVEDVAELRDEDHDRRQAVLMAERRDDRVEPREEPG